jgi:hypothetical protein
MISDEAVEAAHKAWRAQAATDGAIFEYNLRAALEAAAPYIAAEAWDEGARDGQWNAEHIFQTDAGARHAIENPYRSQA